MRPLTRAARRRLTLAALTTAAIVAGACGFGSDEPAPPATSAPGGGTSPSPSASPADLPAGWVRCLNTARGTSMGYPGTWHEPSPALPAAQACSHFQPEPFSIPPNSDYHLIALNATQQSDSVATYLTNMTDPTYFTTVVNEAAPPVAGLPARRFEVTSTGEGLDEAGTRYYGYAIDRAGRAFVVWTVAQPGEARYAEWKGVVDQAVQTLRFL